MYREDHTTDCWINLLRLPIITIVTSSLYNNLFFLCNTAWNKGSRIENLAMCMIPMLRFRYFQVFLLPGFYTIVFFPMFFFYLFILKNKKVKIILTLRCTRGRRGWYATATAPPPKVFLSFLSEPKTSAPDVFSSCSSIHPSFIWAHFESSSVMVSFYGYEI